MCIYIETVFSKPFINLHSQFMWCGAIVFRKLTLGQDASMTEYTSHISKIISSVNPCTAVKINRTVRISNAVITINYTKNTITPLMFLHKHPHKSFSHKFSLHHPSSKIGDKKGLLTFSAPFIYCCAAWTFMMNVSTAAWPDALCHAISNSLRAQCIWNQSPLGDRPLFP